ncbi:MAG: hypothetical protein K9L02_01585 [Acholeplasmataceae bacterium]|nr:hypothetical protein [Acholeplasmataceae bacterium]
MKILEMFKEPINRKDLLSVIKQALFMSVVGGLLVGAVHLLVSQIFHISLEWMFLFIFGMTLARRLQDSYHHPHIIYKIIAIISILITYYLLNVTFFSGYFYMYEVLNIETFKIILYPFGYFSFLNFLNQGFFMVENLLNVFFFIVVNIYVLRYVK